MSITKNIGYAYPSSPLAKELGYNKTGCYYVAVYDDSRAITRHDVKHACYALSVSVQIIKSVYRELEYGRYSMYKGC